MTDSLTSANADDSHSGNWHHLIVVLIVVAAGWHLAAIFRTPVLQSANDTSRWCTVWALVERGTYRIDEITAKPGWHTIDKVRHEEHFYSSKPPLLPTLAAGVYWTIRNTTGWSLYDPRQSRQRTDLVGHLVLLVINWLPMIAAWLVLTALAARYASRPSTRVFVIAAATFGTLLTPFLGTFNNHTVAATAVVFALYPALRISADGSRDLKWFALAGFFAAWTCTNELPAALFGLLMFLWLFRLAPRQTLIAFVPAALIPLAAFFATNYVATGGWKPFYMYYGTEKYVYEVKGIPSYWTSPGGIDRSKDSPLTYLFHCTLGHHGIFSLTPMFLIALAGWWKTVRSGQPLAAFSVAGSDSSDATSSATGETASLPALRPLLWMGLLLTIVVIGFYLTRTQNYNYGGNTAGLRWTFWLIPFWLIAMIPALDSFRSSAKWAIALLLLAGSTASATAAISRPWRQPWLFQQMQQAGWIDYTDAPPAFPRRLTTWFAHLPSGSETDEDYWAIFTTTDVAGRVHRIRMSDAGPTSADSPQRRLMKIEWLSGSPTEDPPTPPEEPPGQESDQSPPRELLLEIDVEQFREGAFPTEFVTAVRQPGAEPPPIPAAAGDTAETEKSDLQEAITFLRGMPAARGYRPGHIRYLLLPLRPEKALRCQLAASRVNFQPPALPDPHWYRCDTWLCDEIPFGAARFLLTVNDARTGTLIARQQFTITEVGKFIPPPAPADTPDQPEQ